MVGTEVVPLKPDAADRQTETLQGLGIGHVGNTVCLDVRKGPPRVDGFQ